MYTSQLWQLGAPSMREEDKFLKSHLHHWNVTQSVLIPIMLGRLKLLVSEFPLERVTIVI